MIKTIISGGQVGADVSGLIAAKKFGIATGGCMPNGCRTLDGPKPEWKEKYNLQEHSSSSYPPRTFLNAKESDGTIRFAYNFGSSGELCTLKALNQYNKPYIDIDIKNPRPIQEVIEWLNKNNIETLNVAGNSEKTFAGMTVFVVNYLSKLFLELGFKEIE